MMGEAGRRSHNVSPFVVLVRSFCLVVIDTLSLSSFPLKSTLESFAAPWGCGSNYQPERSYSSAVSLHSLGY